MKIIAILTMMILGCSDSPKGEAIAEETGNGLTENVGPCHTPIKIIDTGAEIHLIANCDPEQKTVLSKDELKGENGADGSGCEVSQQVGGAKIKCGESVADLKDGSPGRTGSPGPQGPAGTGQDELVEICVHGSDHVDRTKRIKMSDLVKTRWGLAGEYDHPGACENEGECTCDLCYGDPHFDTPLIFHRR